MISIIIPSRNERFLQQTVNDLLAKAEGEVEIIVVYDGAWPETPLEPNNKVRIIHHGTPQNSAGMRASINLGVAIAQGEYIMKIDGHCMVDKGWDTKLVADCKDNWIVIPRRKRLDPHSWTLIEDGRPPIDYMYVSYPYMRPFDRSCGLYGAEWRERYHERKDILIDDTPTMQGSCYFSSKKYWDKLLPNGMDEENYGPFNHEAQEISMAAWLDGGRVVVNKKTWYAHWHKGKEGKGYGFSRAQYRQHTEAKEKARRYAIDYWMNTQDYKHDWKWFMDYFSPVPTWPENWQEQIIKDAETDWSKDPSQQKSEWI